FSAPETDGRPVTLAPPVAPPDRPSSVESLSPARYKIQFTAGAELRRKLERLKALMRSSIPDGDLAAIIEDAVAEKLARLEARRFAKTAAPRKSVREAITAPKARYIPAPVRPGVYRRDGGRCAFVDEKGRRCTARDHLEFHHRHPFGHGGEHEPENLCLMCRAHNAYLAGLDYGTLSWRDKPRGREPVSRRARSTA